MYLQLGFLHIADLAGYDHILFITILCAVYPFAQWKKVLVLITAFTLGHTTTLALSSMNIINIPSRIIEFLIPVTIFITATANILQKTEQVGQKSQWIKYGTALFFGLIHGLGFSYYLRSLLGQEENILLPLFSFNIGIEFGQLFIVLAVFILSFFAIRIVNGNSRVWNLFISITGMVISLFLIITRFPWK